MKARRRGRLGRGCRGRRVRLCRGGDVVRVLLRARRMPGESRKGALLTARSSPRPGRVRAGRRGPALRARRRRRAGARTVDREPALRVRRPACGRRDLPAGPQGRAGAPLPDPRRRSCAALKVPRAYARDVLPWQRPSGVLRARARWPLPRRLWPAGDARRRPARRLRAEQRAARAVLAALGRARARRSRRHLRAGYRDRGPRRAARDLLHGHERGADRGRHRVRAGDLPQECCSGARRMCGPSVRGGAA